ncbi:hypothetical protein SDC9_88825 [bioreactor metagenome]|uniref:Uncharacterized protein n=1 Tax=bioreactor metagenome TaxID=1076179 RepID=A0A644ZU38_9ZZZZ
MFTLQVTAPAYREFELVIVLLKLCDRFGIGEVGKRGVDDCAQSLFHATFDKLAEEGHILAALLQYCLEKVLEKGFGDLHILGEVTEGHFRLDHPEL